VLLYTNDVKYAWEIHSGICVTTNIERGLTELLRKEEGAVFCPQGIDMPCVVMLNLVSVGQSLWAIVSGAKNEGRMAAPR